MAKSKKDHPMAGFMLTNQFNPKYWQWATISPPTPPMVQSWDEEYNARERKKYEWQLTIYTGLLEALAAAQAGDIFPLTRWVAEVLMPCGVCAVYGVLHDRDHDEYGVLVEPHATIVVVFTKFDDNRSPRTLTNVSRRLGVKPECIERPKQGRYGLDNILSYPCHIKYPEKYQYLPEEFASVIVDPSGATYNQIYEARYEAWMNGRGKVEEKKAVEAVDGLIERILDGKITRQMIFLDKKLKRIYARNRSKIEDALYTYGQGKFEKAKRDVSENKWSMVVIFLQGRAGYGKSLYARYFAENLNTWFSAKSGEHWQCYDAAASNGLDDYNCEEIIILDDLSHLSFSQSDWKRLFDNHTTQRIAARYHDAAPVARVLLMTSTKSPHEFFEPVALHDVEDLGQYIRRITARAEVCKCIEQNERGELNLSAASFKLSFPRKVEAYLYGENRLPLEYAFRGEDKEYSAEAASLRLLGMVVKAQLPAPIPYPEGWKERLLSITSEQLLQMTAEAEERETTALSAPKTLQIIAPKHQNSLRLKHRYKKLLICRPI